MHVALCTSNAWFGKHITLQINMNCCLCEQEDRAKLLGELEIMVVRACDQKLKLQDQLARCLEETEVLRQQLKKQMTDHQVSQSGFSPTENRIFDFHRTFLRERALPCCAFPLMCKIFR
jgi:hypothetical protein